jgi:hypothetical protein
LLLIIHEVEWKRAKNQDPQFKQRQHVEKHRILGGFRPPEWRMNFFNVLIAFCAGLFIVCEF